MLSGCVFATVCVAEESLAEKAILAEIRRQYCEPHDSAERFIGAAAAASRISIAARLDKEAVKIASDCAKKTRQ